MPSAKTSVSSCALFAAAALGAILCSGAAWAQPAASGQSPGTPQASSAPQDPSVIAQPQAASAQSDSIDQQIAAWTQDPNLAGEGAARGPAPPRQIHGEAGVAFGSNGYRAGYITTDIPIGKTSDLGIAVGESEISPKHFGKSTNKSLAISLNIGGENAGPPINCGSPTMAMDGRYLEPMWESRLHGEALARDQAACGAPSYGPSPSRPMAPAE